MKALVLLALIFTPASWLFSQQPPSPNTPPPPLPVKHDFDFWIGEWDVYQTGTEVKMGESVVEAVAGGHALYENWQSLGAPQTGKSLTSCHHFTKQWEQFYVGSGGQTTHYKGGFVDGKLVMVAEAVTPSGAKYLNRGTWTNNPDGTVRQQFEISSDGGKTWNLGFDGTYRRKAKR